MAERTNTNGATLRFEETLWRAAYTRLEAPNRHLKI